MTAHRFRPHRTTRSHRTTRARRRTRPMHRPRRHPLAGAAGLFVSRKSSPLRADKGSWAAIRASSCQRSFRSTPLRPRERDLEPSFGASDAPTTTDGGLLLPEADFYKFNRRQSGTSIEVRFVRPDQNRTSIEVPDCLPDQNRTSIEVPDCLRLTFKSPPPGSDDIITTD